MTGTHIQQIKFSLRTTMIIVRFQGLAATRKRIHDIHEMGEHNA